MVAEGCQGVFPRVVDFDSDGDGDLLLGLADGQIQLLDNLGLSSHGQDGMPRLAEPIALQCGPAGAGEMIDVGERATLHVGDFNGDGRFDLIVGALDGLIRVYLDRAETGLPEFGQEIVITQGNEPLVVPSGRSIPILADFNGDGLFDLLVGNTEGQLYFYANEGSRNTPQFAAGVAVVADGLSIDLAGASRSRPCVGDFNADGIMDVLVGSQDGLVRTYLGQNVDADPIPSSSLRVVDANGEPVAIAFDQDTVVIATATWCSACRSFKEWIQQPELSSQLEDLKMIFVFSDESARGQGQLYDPSFAADLPGRVVFLAADSETNPQAFPTVYDPELGLFSSTSAFTWVQFWVATRTSDLGEPDSPAIQRESVRCTSAAGENTDSTGVSLENTALTLVSIGDGVSVLRDFTSGRAIYLCNEASEPLQAYRNTDPAEARAAASLTAAVSESTAAAVALEFVEQYAVEFGVSDSDLYLHGIRQDDIGMTHAYFGRTYQGVPVYGAELHVHLDPTGKVSSANGHVASDISIDTIPALTPLQVEDLARNYFLAEFPGYVPTTIKNELYVLNFGLIGNNTDNTTKLVYDVHLMALDAMTYANEHFFVNAKTGELAYKLSGVKELTRWVYDCSANTITQNGACTINNNTIAGYPNYYFGRSEGKPIRGPNPLPYPYYGTRDVDLMYNLLGVIYGYHLARFGRAGANGQGGMGDGVTVPVGVTRVFVYEEATPDTGCSGAIACSAGISLTLSRGSVITDLIAHEYAHSVLEHVMVAKFGGVFGDGATVYYGEPGSLEENFCDVMGEAAEYYRYGSNNWLVGGELTAGGYLNMADPPVIEYLPGYVNPDRFYHPGFYCGELNHGGIHHNSTVLSKAAYLTAMGGTFNGYTIAPLGWAKMEQIWYRAATEYYTSTETFNGAYALLIQACNDLYSDTDCAELQKALQAVEIDHAGKCSGLPAPDSEVIDQHVFYNHSAFDTFGDDDAIDPSKEALLPGETANSANYTNYSLGTNGLMIDVAHLVNYVASPDGLSAADFEFSVGNTITPSTWADAPEPQSISFDVKQGRVYITWDDGAIEDCWLQVVLKASTTTGLTEDIVFYYGNLVGDVNGDFAVTTADADAVQAAVDPALPVGKENLFDINRDGVVDTTDVQLAEEKVGHRLVKLGMDWTPGDFNLDGYIDSEDLDIWKDGFGTATDASLTDGDADGDSDVDGNDFLIWQQNFSSGLATGTAAGSEDIVSSTSGTTDADDGDFLGTSDELAGSSNHVTTNAVSPTPARRCAQVISQVAGDRHGASFEFVNYAGWSLTQPLLKTSVSSTSWLDLSQIQSLGLNRPNQSIRAIDSIMSELDAYAPRIDLERVHGKGEDIFIIAVTATDENTTMPGHGKKTSLQQFSIRSFAVEDRADLETALEKLTIEPVFKSRDVLCV